jgi:DNA polymerase I
VRRARTRRPPDRRRRRRGDHRDVHRPAAADAADEARLAAARDELVLRHLPTGGIDLRNPANVKSLLRRVGIEVPDTRAWRLEQLRDRHPIVEALLAWRRAERIATTFGYRWLDEHVGPDGRLRGRWSSSDGAAGRMTATAGLHNLPAELRPGGRRRGGPRVRPRRPGSDRTAHPRRGVRRRGADRRHPRRRHVRPGRPPGSASTRDIAKVAVLGAMYGQTTGHGAAALRGLESAYPTAMAYLNDAARRAEGGNDLRTRGGRRVSMSGSGDPDSDDDGEERSRAAARGRYGRNAMVQGAAAEFFKTWAVIVRARAAAHGAHDRAVPPRRTPRARSGRRRRPVRRHRRRRPAGGPSPLGAGRRGPLRRRHDHDPSLVGREVIGRSRPVGRSVS